VWRKSEKEVMAKYILPVLLVAIAVSSYAQEPIASPQTSGARTEKAGGNKWEVQGSIGNEVVVVNGRGDTTLAEEGSEIDGCLVTHRKVICDPAEKRAVARNDTATIEIEVLRKQLTAAVEKLNNKLARTKNELVPVLESMGKTGNSFDLGCVKFAVADDRLIVRVAQGFSDRAKTLLGKAILKEEIDYGYAYYALDKNMVEINWKQE
jgi:hypothetical protein